MRGGGCLKKKEQPTYATLEKSKMCSVVLARSLGFALLPLAACCIMANILLYFPDGNSIYASENKLSEYVWFFAGIVGGGLLMFLPVAVFVTLPKYVKGFGIDTCVIYGSVVAAVVGLTGSTYCFCISALALIDGPKCFTMMGWRYPFKDEGGKYLMNHSTWSICLQPVQVVQWNVTLFSILLVLSGLEAIICTIHIINGLVSVVWRPCYYKRHYSVNT